ncbi:VWA domain-containing protein [Paracoccus sediminis]|uniref:Ca-activated chloride channel family protein n=1 Tax=Paracoccus sediminis TaxID=1214787 RepID=A0A238W0R7_9RHOB|nr:VWA domain-containing protein [Paracoccus sediminis]TBN51476.1 VWA domain-containing protein [Paracoccus sediminis]SNR40150.1 Ca-activated chloride channel family protein [Paracoccus sediminis]
MDGLILLRPWWLLAWLAVAALALIRLTRLPDAGGWERVMGRDMLHAMQALGHLGGRQPRWQRLLAPATLGLLIAAMAGPALPRSDAPVLAQADAVVLAVDLSPSVAQGPGLDQARLATAGLSQALSGRPVGLVLYAGKAFTAAAPTLDVGTLQTQIGVLDAGTMPGKGSRPAAAIGMAAQMLAGLPRADLVLISDGGGVDVQAVAEADRLADRGVRLWALRLTGRAADAPGAPDGALARLVRGGEVMAWDATDRMADRLARSGGSVRDPVLQALQYRDLGPWLAMLALPPLLVMLRRRE